MTFIEPDIIELHPLYIYTQPLARIDHLAFHPISLLLSNGGDVMAGEFYRGV